MFAKMHLPMLLLFAMTCMFTASWAEAEDQIKCYVCGVTNGAADCIENTIPNFSMTKCQKTCFYYVTNICFCRTFGDTCIQPPPPDGVQNSAWEEARFWLDQRSKEMLVRDAGQLVAGFLDWPIPSSLQGDGPHRLEGVVTENGSAYSFSGTLEFWFGTLVIEYDIAEHPTLKAIKAQFDSLGRQGAVATITSKGTKYFEVNPGR